MDQIYQRDIIQARSWEAPGPGGHFASVLPRQGHLVQAICDLQRAHIEPGDAASRHCSPASLLDIGDIPPLLPWVLLYLIGNHMNGNKTNVGQPGLFYRCVSFLLPRTLTEQGLEGSARIQKLQTRVLLYVLVPDFCTLLNLSEV